MITSHLKEQYYDSKGYIRCLIYKNNISIITSPILPLENIRLISITELGEINSCTIKEIKIFIKDNQFIPIYKYTVDKKLVGLWLTSSNIKQAFVYIKKSSEKHDKSSFNNYEEAPAQLMPIIPSNIIKSKHNETRDVEKTANYLKALSVYEYSKNTTKFQNRFVITSINYNVDDIIDDLPPKESSFYNKNGIIIENNVIKERLINYVNVVLFNNEKEVLNFKNRTFIPGLCETSRIGYINFYSNNSFQMWLELKKTKSKEYTIMSQPKEFFHKQPYFYKFNNSLYIIQNVFSGNLEDALNLCVYWNKNKVNKGYYAKNELKELPKKYNILETNNIDEIKNGCNVISFDIGIELNLLLTIITSEEYQTQNDVLTRLINTQNINFPSHDKLWWSSFLFYCLIKFSNYINIQADEKIKISNLGTEFNGGIVNVYSALLTL